MKKDRILKLMVLFLMFGAVACKKAGDSTSSTPTSAELADMVSASLSASTNGLASTSVDMVTNAQQTFNLNIGCGNTKSYGFNRQSPQGSATTYSYAFNYTYTLNCNASNQADNITGTSTDSGLFDGPRFSATNTGSASFKVAGLTQSATAYAINGEYKRTGTFTSKVENKNTSNTTTVVKVTNLLINKSKKTITSGTATITITGNTTRRGTIDFTADLTFTDSGKAAFTINGIKYVVDLLTGEVSKA